ncbi:hypothetical protein NKR23_g10085 [Pleurostoma richardsiae]|uniref:Uncharacterized protein n=1 Tax=Pleurostoma richardsiae TaxID=41990 RepID=A0AA38VEG8_9PEZI|nr:hypothetical protein NKR23_g10085 [Pleurostoma richardsiae]
MASSRPPAKGVPPAPMATDREEWDEERIEAALRRLKDLHVQLRNLRSSIPRMMEPMITQHSSPTALLSATNMATTTVQKEIGDFKSLMLEDSTKKVLDHAEQSRKENPKGIRQWRARDDPDWLNIDSS